VSRIYVFADESGDFTFARKQGASTYFILVTVTVSDCSCGAALMELRRDLAWQGLGLDREFHATSDEQAIRDRVFAELDEQDLRIDATIMEKAKAQPQVRAVKPVFYQYAWFYHMKHLTPKIIRPSDELMVVGAAIGEKKQRSAFRGAIDDVIGQVSPTTNYSVASWAATSEPCLQVADYCAWAIQRKWELGDTRSYDLIKPKIRTEFDMWKFGKTLYY
jgi:hypothetical protein